MTPGLCDYCQMTLNLSCQTSFRVSELKELKQVTSKENYFVVAVEQLNILQVSSMINFKVVSMLLVFEMKFQFVEFTIFLRNIFLNPMMKFLISSLNQILFGSEYLFQAAKRNTVALFAI